MKLVTDYTKLFAGIAVAHEAAADDVVREARRRAPKRTGKFAASIQHTPTRNIAGVYMSLVGSTMSSARVKEKGGYMQARKHSTLFIPQADGSVRRPRAVRVRAQPTIVPAGRMWPEFMTGRLREQSR